METFVEVKVSCCIQCPHYVLTYEGTHVDEEGAEWTETAYGCKELNGKHIPEAIAWKRMSIECPFLNHEQKQQLKNEEVEEKRKALNNNTSLNATDVLPF